MRRPKAVLPQGNVFPFDFGFIPSTKADDGGPLDLLVLLEDSVPMGCALSVRLIGAIEAEQKEKGEVWVRAARVLGDWDAWKWRFAPGWFASLMEKGDRMRSRLELAHFGGARAAPFALGSNIVTRSKAGANYERY